MRSAYPVTNPRHRRIEDTVNLARATYPAQDAQDCLAAHVHGAIEMAGSMMMSRRSFALAVLALGLSGCGVGGAAGGSSDASVAQDAARSGVDDLATTDEA